MLGVKRLPSLWLDQTGGLGIPRDSYAAILSLLMQSTIDTMFYDSSHLQSHHRIGQSEMLA